MPVRQRRPEKMKYQLADALKQCMSKMPVEKITVKEIVEECGTTRQTFYRNCPWWMRCLPSWLSCSESSNCYSDELQKS